MSKNEMLEQVMADLEPQMRAALAESVMQQVKWQASRCVEEQVKAWFAENVAGVVIQHLTENKGAVIAASIEAADKIGDVLRDAMVKTATERLSASYSNREVMKQLFGF